MATSNSAIKITELPNIGNNIAASTLIPVVNMAGVPITQKANLQITGNLILAGAGGAQFVPAAVANLAYTVVNSYQPNITRVGNLNINTFKVTGGVNGQYLQTDGTGNLAWVSGGGTGNGVVGGSNTQIQYNNAGNFGGSSGLTWNSSTGVLSTLNLSVSSGATIYGNTALTNLNVAGNFTTNNIYTDNYFYANGDPFGGISGITVKDEGTNVVASANTINFVGAGVTTSNVGGVATITINGGNGNADTGNVTFSDQAVIGTGDEFGGSGLYLAPGANSVGNVQYLRVRGGDVPTHIHLDTGDNGYFDQYFGDDGKYVKLESGGNISIGTNTHIWAFDPLGNLTLPNTANVSINYANGSPYGGGNANTGNVTFDNVNIIGDGNLNLQPDPANSGSYLDIFLSSGPDIHIVASASANLILGKDNQSNVMTSWDGNVYIQSWDNNTNTQGGVWTFDGDGNLTLPNDANIAIYGNTTQFNTCPNGFLGLNSYDAGSNNIARVNISSVDELVSIGISDPITEDEFNWTFATGGGTIFPTLDTQRGDNPSGTITGQTLLFGDNTQEAIISTPDGVLGINGDSSQRLVINPGEGYQGGEGGDIYLWAGRGGNASGSGGDIKIRGGQGGANTVGGAGGAGGYIRMEAGDAATTGGNPGYIEITGGYSNAVGGYVNVTGGQGATVGGDVKIYGGYGAATGGNVNIWGGSSGNGQSNEGHVNIETGGNTWTFAADGTTRFPNDTIKPGNGIPIGILTQSGNVYTQINQYPNNWEVYSEDDTTGANSGWAWIRADLPTVDTPQVFIETQKGSDGIPLRWTFDENGNLTLPGNISAPSYTNYVGESVSGGNLVLSAGTTWACTNPGGSVFINAGNAPYSGQPGNIELNAHGNIWKFDGAGNLTLPGNTFAVNYANGTQVSIGGSGNTGNVTFDDVTVQGVNQLNLSAGADFTANLAYLQVRGGDVASHIHLDTGNNEAYDLIVGNDDKFVQVSSTGNIIMSSYDGNASYTWTFDTTGNLTLPLGSIVYETNIPDGALSGSAIALKPIGGTTANQQLLIYPTAADGDHIHMTSGNLYATELFLGSDNFYVKLANTGNVVINSNDGNSSNAMWTFDTDGNLTLPGNLVINGLTNVFGSNVALLQSNPDLPLLSVSSGSNGGASSIWAEDIGNIGTSNIAAVYANPTPGSGIVRIAVGQNGGNAGPSLWDFNASGALTLPQGSQISETSNTSVNITANANTWAFGVNGNLTLPNSATIIAPNVNDLTLRVTGQYNICTLLTGGSGYGGGGSSSAISGGTGTGMIVGYGYGLSGQVVNVGVTDPGTGYSEGDVLTMTAGNGGATFVITKYNTAANAGNNNTAPTDWTFGVDGNITLPNNYSSINYANGSPYGGGGGNTGNVTFSDQIVIGTGSNDGSGGLYLAPGNNSIANSAVQYLRVRGGDVATHIHLDTGNNQFYDQYFGDDAKYVKLANTGNVVIGTDDGNGNQYSWSFDTDGNLTTPSNLVIGPGAGSGSRIFQYDEGLEIVGEGANSVVAIGWTANASAPDSVASIAMNYPSGGEGNVLIAVGNNATTVNYWLFDNTGNTTFPRDTGPNTTDPILTVSGGATPTIRSDVFDLTAPANLAIVADYLNLSGSTGNRIAIYADNGEIGTEANMVLYTNLADPGNIVSWILDTTGNLTLPDTTSVLANVSITLEANDTGNITGLSVIGDSHANLYAHGNITLYANTGGAGSTWTFDNSGNLTLPGNTFAVNYANGTQVSLGGGGNTDWANIGNINNANGPTKIAIGQNAGSNTQGTNSVAIGNVAGQTTQGFGAVAIGSSAGSNTQGGSAVALGDSAGENSQGVYSVAIGYAAAQINQGTSAVAVGFYAGQTNQGNNSIILNATGAALNQTVANTFTVAPVRNDTSNIAEVMFYNATSKEVTYGNTLSVAGNITGAYVLGNGSGLTSLPAPTVAQDITSNGAMSIMTYDGNLKYVNYATVEPSTGNIAGGNISTTGVVTANTANITTGNITTINSGLLQNGNSNITITSNGNVSIQAAGSNVELVVTSTGANVTGTLSATGNITGANLVAGSSGAGNVYAGNVIVNGQPTTYGVANLTTGVVAVQATATGTVSATVVANTSPNGSTCSGGSNTSPGLTVLTVAIPTAGTWRLDAELRVDMNSGGYMAAAFYDNGTLIPGSEYWVAGGAQNKASGTGSGQYSGFMSYNVTTTGARTVTLGIWSTATTSVIDSGDGRTWLRATQLDSIFALNTLATMSVTGNISANNFIGNGGGLSNVATKITGSWTLASGNNTVSISIPLNGTYSIWVNGNIPNGIITYTATAVITNTNVPVLGEQYGWYYAIGNALVLTSIPNQFTGTVGSISTVNTYAGNTANVFTFGITNNSGSTAVVNYGYTKL